MKKNTMKYATTIVLALIMVISITSIALAGSGVTSGSCGGATTHGSSDTGIASGSASTVIDVPPYCSTASVSSTYHYINIDTYNSGSTSSGSGGSNAAGVSFYAPARCISVSVSSSHYTTYNGDTWSGSSTAFNNVYCSGRI